MNRYIPFIIIGGILYAVFSTCEVRILTWKDSDNLERIVITPKNTSQKSNIPPVPPISQEDERFDQGEGPIAVGSYAVKSLLKMIPKEKADIKDDHASVQSRYSQRHLVGKFPSELSELPPKLPENEPKTLVSVSDTTTVSVSPKTKLVAQLPVLEEEMDVHDYSDAKIPRIRNYDDRILIASFNVDPWWEEDSRNSPELQEEMLSVLVQFDMVAIQGFRIDNVKFLDDLVAQMSEVSAGKKFHYVAAVLGGLRVSENDPALIFVYDSTTMEVDPLSVSYMGKVNEPFKYRPLAATFRTRKTSSDKAFTFTAINVFLATQRERMEFAQFPQMIQKARNIKTGNSVHEDDIIVMGHFGLEPTEPLPRDFSSAFTWSVFGRSTNAWGGFRSTTENICYLKDATVEAICGGVWCLKTFFHRSEGIPFDYHPVWLQLSIYEGGKSPKNNVW
ncbi:MAG: hypothetical protein Q4C96_06815 [Planctomycetia bacterium]|nr:hypothetical protein [Planctomycetia bacterium]